MFSYHSFTLIQSLDFCIAEQSVRTVIKGVCEFLVVVLNLSKFRTQILFFL